MRCPTNKTFRFQVKFIFQYACILVYKMWNCSCSHGINVIIKDTHLQTIAHLTKLYLNFQRMISYDDMKSGKVPESIYLYLYIYISLCIAKYACSSLISERHSIVHYSKLYKANQILKSLVVLSGKSKLVNHDQRHDFCNLKRMSTTQLRE